MDFKCPYCEIYIKLPSTVKNHIDVYHREYSTQGSSKNQNIASRDTGSYSQASQYPYGTSTDQRENRFGAALSSKNRSTSTFGTAMSSSSAGLFSRHSGSMSKYHRALANRSKLSREFGIQNKNNSLNCFLNVGLQALWAFPALRAGILSFCDEKDRGPAELKPFINALQDFFTKANEDSSSVKVHDPSALRRELFKLSYKRENFVLNEKADAFEAFDQILGLMHAWTAFVQNEHGEAAQARAKRHVLIGDNEKEVVQLQQSECRDNSDSKCFIHGIFFVDHQSRKVCSCGSSSEVQKYDANLFGETLNMYQTLRSFEHFFQEERVQKSIRLRNLAQQSPELQEAKVQFLSGKFFDALRTSFNTCTPNKCLDKVCRNHETKTQNVLDQPDPEVLSFNLQWDGDPTPNEILQTLIALPEVLRPSDFYNGNKPDDRKESIYVLKGLICFQTAHYLAYFRRILIKYDFLNLDYKKVVSQLNEVRREITPETEWVLYDDNVVHFEPNNWAGVLERCIQIGTYPTVLFYEKLNPDEEYKGSQGFRFSPTQYSQLQRQAQRATKDLYGDDGQIFSQADILNQLKIEQEMQRSLQPVKNLTSSLNPLNSSTCQPTRPTTSTVRDIPIRPDLEEEKKEVTTRSKVSERELIEEDKKQRLKKLKLEYFKEGVYLFPCHNCDDIQMLHLKACLFCKKENPYYENPQNFGTEMTKKVLGDYLNLMKTDKFSSSSSMVIKEQAQQVQEVPVQPDQSQAGSTAATEEIRATNDTNVINTEAVEMIDTSAAQNQPVPEHHDQGQQPEDQSQLPAASNLQQPSQPEAEPVVDQKQYETKWKCWKCREIYSMEQACRRCHHTIQDYSGEIAALICEVEKIEVDQEAGSNSYWKCSGCNYTNEFSEHGQCAGCMEQMQDKSPVTNKSQQKIHDESAKKESQVQDSVQKLIQQQDDEQWRCLNCQTQNPWKMSSEKCILCSEKNPAFEQQEEKKQAPVVGAIDEANTWKCEGCGTANSWEITAEKCMLCQTENPALQNEVEAVEPIPEPEVVVGEAQFQCGKCTFLNTLDYNKFDSVYCEACDEIDEGAKKKYYDKKFEQQKTYDCPDCGQFKLSSQNRCTKCEVRQIREEQKNEANRCPDCHSYKMANSERCVICQGKYERELEEQQRQQRQQKLKKCRMCPDSTNNNSDLCNFCQKHYCENQDCTRLNISGKKFCKQHLAPPQQNLPGILQQASSSPKKCKICSLTFNNAGDMCDFCVKYQCQKCGKPKLQLDKVCVDCSQHRSNQEQTVVTKCRKCYRDFNMKDASRIYCSRCVKNCSHCKEEPVKDTEDYCAQCLTFLRQQDALRREQAQRGATRVCQSCKRTPIDITETYCQLCFGELQAQQQRRPAMDTMNQSADDQPQRKQIVKRQCRQSARPPSSKTSKKQTNPPGIPDGFFCQSCKMKNDRVQIIETGVFTGRVKCTICGTKFELSQIQAYVSPNNYDQTPSRDDYKQDTPSREGARPHR